MFGFAQLGTGVQRPTPDRQLTSAFVQFQGDQYLFDAPEGIQTTLQRDGTGMKLDAIFTTGITNENLLGLPGLLTTLQTLGEKNNSDELASTTIYVPAGSGTEQQVRKFIELSNNDAVTVKTVTAGDSPVEADSYTIDVFPTKRSTGGPSVGYRVREHNRPGQFNRERAEDLGVPVGPKFGRLHAGEPVELADGRVIQPEQVVGDPRPGRSFAYTGATEHFPELADHIRGTDVLLCDGGITSSDYSQQPAENHMSAYQAGTIAETANVSVLLPTHIRGVYGPNANVLKGDLNESFDGHYILPRDGIRYSLIVQNTPGRATHHSDVLSKIST